MTAKKGVYRLFVFVFILTLACGVFPVNSPTPTPAPSPIPTLPVAYANIFPPDAPTPVATSIPENMRVIPVGYAVADADGKALIESSTAVLDVTVQDTASNAPLAGIQIQAFANLDTHEILVVALDPAREYFPLVKIVNTKGAGMGEQFRSLGVTNAKALGGLALVLFLVKIYKTGKLLDNFADFFFSGDLPEIRNYTAAYFDACFSGEQLATYFSLKSGLMTYYIPVGKLLSGLEKQIMQGLLTVSTTTVNGDQERYLRSLPGRYLVRVYDLPRLAMPEDPRTRPLALVGLEIMGSCGDEAPASDGANTQIVFISERDGNPEVYRMSADGGNVIRLTNNAGWDASPLWSPDKQHIAFMSERDGNTLLYVMNADGTEQKPLNAAFQQENALRWFTYKWSPDGRYMALASEDKLFILQMTDESVVYNQPIEPGAAVTGFDWSPDSQQMVIATGAEASSSVYTLAVPQGSLNQITQTDTFIQELLWSPAGDKFAFSASCFSQGFGLCAAALYVMGADGTGLTGITDGEVPHWLQGWTPDGQYILYDIPSSAFLITPDGLTTQHIIDEENYEELRVTDAYVRPTLSPDGQQVVFSSYRDKQWEIYVVNVDGTGLTNLTNSPGRDGDPDW